MNRIPIGFRAGHGGRNLGTHWPQRPPYSLVESLETLPVAKRIVSVLEDGELVEPILIRQEDIYLKHRECNAIAKRAGCRAVVDLHFNWSVDPDQSGGVVFHRPGDHEGRALGVEILSAIEGRDWQTRRSDYRYLGAIAYPGAYAITHAYDRPCALLELAYFSNSGDRRWVEDPTTIDVIAQAAREGCESWVTTFHKDLISLRSGE